jgi:heat shock protein beta
MGTSALGAYSHFKTEGDVDFTGLLFVQERAPFDLYDKYYEKKNVMKLYVRRIMINDKFEDLLPRWLNFVEGIVDSDSLTLNVNRENLQQSRHLKAIGKKLVTKAIEMLSSYDPNSEEAEEEEVTNDIEVERDDIFAKKKTDMDLKIEKFNRFEENYGKNIRLGILE